MKKSEGEDCKQITEEQKDTCSYWVRNDCLDLYNNELYSAIHCRKRVSLMRLSLTHAYGLKSRCQAAQFLEFGVHQGKDIARMAAYLQSLDSESCSREKYKSVLQRTVFHGFDSFVGLPEEWSNGQLLLDGSSRFKQGKFGTDGEMPRIDTLKIEIGKRKAYSTPSGVQFHKGWFQESLPTFLDSNGEPIAFVHADADLYSSTKSFLTNICQRRLLMKGSVLLFDEFWNYEGWQDGEYKAWCEAVNEFQLIFSYFGIHAPSSESTSKNSAYGHQSVCVVIDQDM